MIKFEIPFNFEKDYVEKLQARKELHKYIDSIYAAAWKDDCDNSRSGLNFRDDYPQSYEEYVERLKELISIGIDVCILAQRNATLEMVERYIALGVKSFTLSDDDLAGQVKAKYPDIRLSLSATRALTKEEIINGDFSMYDRIVLFFWFSKHLDELEELPKKNKYVIMCNSRCYYDCKWHDAHWFLKADSREEYSDKENTVCKRCYEIMSNDTSKAAYIAPEDLIFFDPYVVTYKLVDRADYTDAILEYLKIYANRVQDGSKGRVYYNIDENEAAQ